MQSYSQRSALAFLALMPSSALAHGEGVLLFPFGSLAAFIAVLIFSFVRSYSWFSRLAACAAAVAASIPFLIAPGDIWPVSIRYEDWLFFLAGFLPSLAAGLFVGWLLHRLGRKQNVRYTQTRTPTIPET